MYPLISASDIEEGVSDTKSIQLAGRSCNPDDYAGSSCGEIDRSSNSVPPDCKILGVPLHWRIGRRNGRAPRSCLVARSRLADSVPKTWDHESLGPGTDRDSGEADLLEPNAPPHSLSPGPRVDSLNYWA